MGVINPSRFSTKQGSGVVNTSAASPQVISNLTTSSDVTFVVTSPVTPLANNLGSSDNISVIAIPGPKGDAGPQGPQGVPGSSTVVKLNLYEFVMPSTGDYVLTIPGLATKIDSSATFLWVNGLLQTKSSYTCMDYGIDLPSSLGLVIGDNISYAYYLL